MTPTGKALRFSKNAVIFLLFLLCSTTLTAQNVLATNTLLLPLKVQSFQSKEQYSKIVDQSLDNYLTSKDILLLPRSKAETLVDYTKGSWPPSTPQLKKLALATDTENIVTGIVTAIGKEFSIDVKYFDLLAPNNPVYFYQTARSKGDLYRALEKIAQEIDQYNNRQFRIASISPKGNNRIDSGAILHRISSKHGDIYNQTKLRDDLKEIFKMGYFDDVQLEVIDGAKGKEVIFLLKEKPVIQTVQYIGVNELKEDDVKAAANIKENFLLNQFQLTNAKQAILQLYKSKGFYNSTVETSISYPDNQGARVEFVIDEGKKTYIKEINIEGNKAFSDSKIIKQIQTGERWFMSWITDSGLLDQAKAKQDTQLIQAFYADNGYLDAKVSDPVITQEKDWLYITFKVNEGQRYQVGTVEVAGDVLGDEKALLNLLAMRNEKYVSRTTVRDDILKLTDYFAEEGYAFANIRPNFQKVGDDRMDIVFHIDKGNLVYIDRIVIRGNTRTRDNVIRRELRIEEGGIFDAKALRLSSQALQRLQYFEEVNITPEPSLDPNRMTVIINVKERSTGAFSIGAGYSSADNLLFMGKISENNFLGRGDSLAFSASIGGKSSYFNLGYTNPHLNDSQLSWGVDAFHTTREYDDYTRESTGGGLRVGYPIWEKWRIYANYSLTDTDLSDVRNTASYIIKKSVDINLTSALKFSLVRDTRNLRFGATKGSRNVFSVKYAGGPLGGDAEFTKVEGSSGWYFPLFWGTSFHTKIAAGQVFENKSDKLPVYERFYLGGLNSIRGFKYAKVSPIDPETGERIGGDKMWYTNLEYIFPLLKTQGIHGLVFFDAGKVLYDIDDIGTDDDVKKAVGAGVNWLSPMGPLQFVLGYNLDPTENEDDSVFDFSIGGSF